MLLQDFIKPLPDYTLLGISVYDNGEDIKVESQVSIYDIMKSWCDLQQKCKDDNERFYDYYFEDETNTTYRLTNIYISNVGGHYDKEVKLSFNYDDKKRIFVSIRWWDK